MMKKTASVLGCALLMLGSAAGVASAGDQWLHVRVEEFGRGAETVSVNIPLSMVKAVLPVIDPDDLDIGSIDFHHDKIDGIDLRELLAALQDAPDANFVTVRSEDENIRVAKEDGFLIVDADDRDEKVRVRMPLGVVEALLGGDGDRLDLMAALDRLAEFDGGDLVTVESDDESIRIWIDNSDSGD